MNRDERRDRAPDRSPRRQRIRTGGLRPALVGAALAALVLTAAGCGGGSGGPQVAQAGSTTTTTAKTSSKGSPKADGLALSKCMRDHGIADFPDPDSQGRISISVTGGPGSTSDLTPDSPQFQAAQKACQALGLGPGGGTPAQQADAKAAALKYSKCMRSHGIPDFPDPNSSGGLEIKGTPGGDLDPGSTQFQAADKACQKFMPGHGKGGSTFDKKFG
jgi:hypothetical protein